MLALDAARNEHIRIDIVNNLLPKRVRNIIDVVGHAFFLLPLCIIMIVTGVPFFLRSFEVERAVAERRRPAAMAGQVAVMIAFALLLIQGFPN